MSEPAATEPATASPPKTCPTDRTPTVRRWIAARSAAECLHLCLGHRSTAGTSVVAQTARQMSLVSIPSAMASMTVTPERRQDDVVRPGVGIGRTEDLLHPFPEVCEAHGGQSAPSSTIGS